MDKLTALYRALPPLPQHVLIGLSGGADSVALLRLLLLRRAEGACQLAAIHVNHGLRGDDADADEAFVRSLCAAWNVPLYCRRAVPPAHPSEGWAREARYAFFHEVMALTGCDALVLAHHRDDQAETLLLHLLRGAGLNGMGGMAADATVDGMRILRPLLAFGRAELREALTELGQPWREDASNQDERYLRNAIRMELLPLMDRLAPGAPGRIAAAAALLQQDAALLDQQAAAFLDAHAGDDWLLLEPLMHEPAALQKRILRLWWRHSCADGMDERALSAVQTDALHALLTESAGKRCNLPGGWHAQRGWRCLHLIAPSPCSLPEPQPLGEHGAALGDITLTICPALGTPGDGRTCQELPRTLLEGCVLRCRQRGDWLRPFGSQGRQSLQDYLTNRRVDAPFRNRIPLLCRGSEVLLVCGVGAGDLPRHDPDISDNVRLTWHGPIPWLA